MKRFSAALAAIVTSVALLANCANASDPANKTEEDAREDIIAALQEQGFKTISVGPFFHEAPSVDSPVSAANVKIEIGGPRECFAQVFAVPDLDNGGWRVIDSVDLLEPRPMTPEDAVRRYHCDGG